MQHQGAGIQEAGIQGAGIQGAEVPGAGILGAGIQGAGILGASIEFPIVLSDDDSPSPLSPLEKIDGKRKRKKKGKKGRAKERRAKARRTTSEEDKEDDYPVHWGANPKEKTGVGVHTDHSRKRASENQGAKQRVMQVPPVLGDCTMVVYAQKVGGSDAGRYEHARMEHYEAFEEFVEDMEKKNKELNETAGCREEKPSDAIPVGFTQLLKKGGKVDWPFSRKQVNALFEQFRLEGDPRYRGVRLVLCAPPPELVEGYQGSDGTKPTVMVTFRAGTLHSGPSGGRGNGKPAVRLILFDTQPVNERYISDESDNTPGWLESRILDLKQEADCLIRCSATKYNLETGYRQFQRCLINQISHFKAKYRAKNGKPLVMMSGSSHRNFVERLLLMAFTQPTVSEMRATLWWQGSREFRNPMEVPPPCVTVPMESPAHAEELENYVAYATCNNPKTAWMGDISKLLSNRIFNYLNYFADEREEREGITVARPASVDELFEKRYGDFRKGPNDVNRIDNCSMGLTMNGFGVGGACFAFPPQIVEE